jgi:hypothetical protein
LNPATVDPPEDLRVVICGTAKDLPELNRIKKGLIKALREFGGYVPEVDDLLVDEIASNTIYWKKAELFLDADTATEMTYARVADARMKFQAMIDSAMKQLALTRRDRLNQQEQGDLMARMRELIQKAKKN